MCLMQQKDWSISCFCHVATTFNTALHANILVNYQYIQFQQIMAANITHFSLGNIHSLFVLP